MTMGSHRSSDGDVSTSNDEEDGLDMKNSISLEFDDYPLDLVSPLTREDNDFTTATDWTDFRRDQSLDFGDPQDQDSTFLAANDDVFKFVNERDRFLTDEIITDFGKRKSGEYDVGNGGTRNENDVFVTGSAIDKTGKSADVIYDSAFTYSKTRSNCCKRFRNWLRLSCRLCLSKYYSVPDSPVWYDRWRYALLCPPHGWISHLIALALLTLIFWGILWTIDPSGASYKDGKLFALLTLGVVGFVAGRLVECVRVSPILGMFAVGFAMRNIPGINLTRNIDLHTSAVLRELGMASLVLRCGLALTPQSLRQQGFSVLRLVTLPSLCEAVIVGLTAKLILGLPWLWSFLLGLGLCACGPAVACPTVLSLQSRGYGLDKNLASLVVSATAVDIVLPLTGFYVINTLLFKQDSLVLAIFRGPLEAMGGVLGAMVVSSILWYIPHRQYPRMTLLRVLLLSGCCYLFVLGSWSLGLTRLMPVGGVTLVFVTMQRWRKENRFGEKGMIDEALKVQWHVLQSVFYGLLGAQVHLSELSVSAIGPGLAVIVISCVVRLAATLLSQLGTALTHKEKLFVALVWLAKSSVQLSLSPVIMSSMQLYHSDGDETFNNSAKAVSSVLLLSVLTTLPTGTILATFTAPYLLSHTSHLVRASELEKFRPGSLSDGGGSGACHPDLAKLRGSEVSNVTTEVEITTERETVT